MIFNPPLERGLACWLRLVQREGLFRAARIRVFSFWLRNRLAGSRLVLGLGAV
jgi:hypothetical protein